MPAGPVEYDPARHEQARDQLAYANTTIAHLLAENAALRSGAVSMKAMAEQAWKERDEAVNEMLAVTTIPTVRKQVIDRYRTQIDQLTEQRDSARAQLAAVDKAIRDVLEALHR